ncbi:MAG: aldose 1-epimerase [Parvibaculum sp.]
MLKLANPDIALHVLPDRGGGIMKFEAFGRQVLRLGKGLAPHPSELSGFSLLPYCNRIAEGHIPGHAALKPNLPKEPHPIHGEGWLSRWQVDEESADQATLSLDFQPSAGRWPWAFTATQSYRLDGAKFHHTLSLTNLSEHPMPAGLGFHPYFSYRRGDLFQASVKGMWDRDGAQLPTHHHLVGAEQYWPRGRIDETAHLDNCFTGWDGRFQITRRDISIQVTTSGNLPFLHIYAPAGEAFVCLEPVSHIPNAINFRDAPPMARLMPRDTISASLTYDVSLA